MWFFAGEHNHAIKEKTAPRRVLREFSLRSTQFIDRYRFLKELVRNLLEELKPHPPEPNKYTDSSLEAKVGVFRCGLTFVEMMCT